ncbi:hypothetical protein KC340_g14298 [Hortaea werneckii]|nr:hypothetical protein KC342_g13750 [Hortaea werneckii]KAI7069529.1 hypothetical protein KC339_g14800 [Hortaea werneckii]KAI7220426.1 hypothetical protein KC365_g12028 [Hortaea werneckii]KAI7298508.1 hypothetical protein KC340_g14298 [Hortaea werneckii]KAI7374504.1 hypothetical protein KC328_g15971 [Hortaea werneckii]
MPTELPTTTTTESQDAQDRALQPLTDAIINMHGRAVSDFTKAVFGDQRTETALAERREEIKGMPTNGSFGEAGSCTSLMRSYVVLKGELGEDGNAAELRGIAERHFGREMVAQELLKVESGW